VRDVRAEKGLCDPLAAVAVSLAPAGSFKAVRWWSA